MSVKAKAGVAGKAAQVALHRIGEVLSREDHAQPGTVPIRIDHVDVHWLSAALCCEIPGAQVTEFALGPQSDGTSARRSLTVSYNRQGEDAGLPHALFTKTTPDIKTRLFTGLTNLFVGETHFYNTIRPSLPIESPHGYHCAFDVASCRSILILEDIASTRGAVFGSPQTLHISRDQALDMTSVMATYHREFWNSPRLDADLAWLQTSPDWQRHLNSVINTEAMVRRGLTRAESVLPDALLLRRDDLWPAFMTSLERKATGPITLLHHDVHSKNWYVNGDGRMGLYDWQTIVKGTWSVDFSYAINCGLSVEDRREWLPDLMKNYLDELTGGISDPPSIDDAWRGYREQSIHGLIFWLATIGAGRLQPDLHDEKDCLINIERLAHATIDADTIDALT